MPRSFPKALTMLTVHHRDPSAHYNGKQCTLDYLEQLQAMWSHS